MWINYSGISRKTRLGKALRRPLALLPCATILPIMQGPARGALWITGSSTHGCWLGSYEYATQKAMRQCLRPGMTFYDVGANVGFYSVLASRLVGPGGTVLAIEPLPANVVYLRRHVKMNHLKNVRVLEAAALDRPGTVRFAVANERSCGSVTDSGTLEVSAVTLDSALRHARTPHVVKIDVEGAEAAALRGADELLRGGPVIFLALHGHEQRVECFEILHRLGYRMSALDGGSLDRGVFDLVAVPLLGYEAHATN